MADTPDNLALPNFRTRERTLASNDPDIIRAEIARTRAGMASTIDQIQHRLSPAYMKQQAQETIRESITEKVEHMAIETENTVNHWRTNAMNTIRENPLPAAMVGIGLGWLLLKGSRSNDSDYYPTADASHFSPAAPQGRRYYEEPGLSDQMLEQTADAAENAGEWASKKLDSAQETLENAADDVKDTVGDAAAGVKETVGDVVAGAQNKSGEAFETAQDYRRQASQQARETAYHVRRETRRETYRARQSFWDMLDENPLAVGVATMAAGALVGLALPSTTKEDQLLGETRDRLMEEAKATAEETARKMQAVAEEAQHAAVDVAKEEARNQDLPVDKVAENSAKNGKIPEKRSAL